MNVDELLKAADKGASQVMECLNTENASKANLGKKRRAVGQKPASLSAVNMKKPMAAAATSVEAEKENASATVEAKKQEADNEESSDPELGCLACGS